MVSQRFDNRNNPESEPFCGIRFVFGHVTTNLLQSRYG
jgi:hypothetical protein